MFRHLQFFHREAFMPDDLFGSIRDISTRIQTEIAEAPQPAEAAPATSGGMSDIGNQLEVVQNMSLFMEAFAPQGNSFDPATQFRPGELPTEISFADLVQGTQVQTPTPSALPPPAGKPNAEALAAIEAELQNDPANMDNITAALGGITSYD